MTIFHRIVKLSVHDLFKKCGRFEDKIRFGKDRVMGAIDPTDISFTVAVGAFPAMKYVFAEKSSGGPKIPSG